MISQNKLFTGSHTFSSFFSMFSHTSKFKFEVVVLVKSISGSLVKDIVSVIGWLISVCNCGDGTLCCTTWVIFGSASKFKIGSSKDITLLLVQKSTFCEII